MDRSRNSEEFEASWAKIAPVLTEHYPDVAGFHSMKTEEKLAYFQEGGVSLSDLERILPYLEQLPDRVAPELVEVAIRAGSKCPLGWRPSALLPGTYGYTTYVPPYTDFPGAIRVYFPSMGLSTPASKRIPLVECGRFPLILFLHGWCPNDPNQYIKWNALCGQLARSGYVVIAPQLLDIDPLKPSESHRLLAQRAVSWIRSNDRLGQILLPETAVIGHSYGAILGAWLVNENEVPIKAFASLSGSFALQSDPRFLPFFNIPKFFAWGRYNSNPFEDLENQPHDNPVWSRTPNRKHKVIFDHADHWEYLPPTVSKCGNRASPCPIVGNLANDFATTFMGRYIPTGPFLPMLLPISLWPWTLLGDVPIVRPSPKQKQYLRYHFVGFKGLKQHSNCRSLTHHAWVTGNGKKGELKW